MSWNIKGRNPNDRLSHLVDLINAPAPVRREVEWYGARELPLHDTYTLMAVGVKHRHDIHESWPYHLCLTFIEGQTPEAKVFGKDAPDVE